MTKQHVQLPNDMSEMLEPKDLVIYLTIKRYMNNETKEAFPSLETISKVSGAAINTCRKCIQNLVDKQYLKVYKKGKVNHYIFLKWDKFEPFSYEFLDKEDLTFVEKSYLIASQQFMYKENGEGKLSYSNVELSKKINMPEATIRKCDKSLQDKNYLQIVKTNKRDNETGCAIREKFYHLTKLEQAIVFALQNHEERINNNEEAIKNLQKDNAILLAELKRLSAKLDSQLVM